MARVIARSPRKRPRQARSRVTFEAILEAGARVLVDEGYDRASTNRIAEVAGVSIGSLYEFFPNKDAIFTELRRALNEEMLGLVTARMEAALDLPVREAVRTCVTLLVEAHSIDPRLEAALKERVPDRALAEQDRHIERELTRLGMAFVNHRRAELRRDNLEVAVFVAIQAAESLTHEAARRIPDKLESGEVLEEVSDLITRYLAKD